MAKRNGTKYPPDPYQWYREPRHPVEQLFDNIDFGDDLIFDPSCGSTHPFEVRNFLSIRTRVSKPDGKLSLVNNPPYGEVEGLGKNMGTRFVEHALKYVDFHRAAFLVPVEFACGQARWRLYHETPPSHVLFCNQRPSMPPGQKVIDLGANAFREGMAEYIWVVFTRGHDGPTEAIFMKPDDVTVPPKRAGRRIRN